VIPTHHPTTPRANNPQVEIFTCTVGESAHKKGKMPSKVMWFEGEGFLAQWSIFELLVSAAISEDLGFRGGGGWERGGYGFGAIEGDRGS